MDLAFFKENTFLSYFSAEAYQFFLPIMLVKTLESFEAEPNWRDPDYVFYAIARLGPDYWDIYNTGHDIEHKRLSSILTKAQYLSVCSFLGFCLDYYNRSFFALEALIDNWNRFECPALRAAKSLTAELHNYQYPKLNNPDAELVAQQIREAFKSNSYPGDNLLVTSLGGGDEPTEYAVKFRGLNWQTLDPRFIHWSNSALSFLSKHGYHYFLPAFMLVDLLPECGTSAVFHLTSSFARKGFHGLKVDLKGPAPTDDLSALSQDEKTYRYWSEYDAEKHSLFTLNQRQAIVAYLRFKAAEDPYHREEINSAIDEYWLKSISA